MLDTSRHFLPVSSIKRTIDGMRITKLNILHLHLTDSESFPLYIQPYHNISEYGAYSQSEVYSNDDIIELVKYGQINGVSIIPELDSPAHTRAWAMAPELNDINACHDYPPE